MYGLCVVFYYLRVCTRIVVLPKAQKRMGLSTKSVDMGLPIGMVLVYTNSSTRVRIVVYTNVGKRWLPIELVDKGTMVYTNMYAYRVSRERVNGLDNYWCVQLV